MISFTKYLIFLIFNLIIYIFTCYINVMHFLDVYKDWLLNVNNGTRHYDYIIVGGGSAGATLASKLTDDNQTVLLVEAGGIASPFLDIPLLTPLLQKTVYDWQYVTVPQEHACKALLNNQSRWPMGKVLGGTSRLNYMAYVRGHPLDYNEWFPNFSDYNLEKHESIKIDDLRWNTKLADAILMGTKEMAQEVGDINDDLDIGFMKTRLFIDNGKRWCTDKALFEKFNRKLTIIIHARVDKILMDSNKAVGIKFMKQDTVSKAMASKGIILSAGVIGSPKLLMLSGIGPKKHLEDIKINVINDLPVGKNLVDHILTGIDLVTLNTNLPLSMISALNPISAFNYFFYGEGPWTFSGIEVLGTFHSSLQKNSSSAPDLQLLVLPMGISQDNGIVLKKAMGISDKLYDQYFAPLESKSAITIAPVLLHPKSSGEIKLRSSNPADKPLINPKYLSNKDDIYTLIHGIQFVKNLLKTNAMKDLGASLYEKQFPGCEDKVFDSTQYWICYIQHLTLTSYHPSGTCRIGSVVDTSFKVYNTTNLYVVDASVLPSLPSANINAAVIMLAVKASNIFRQIRKMEYQYLSKCQKTYLLCYIFNVCDYTCMKSR